MTSIEGIQETSKPPRRALDGYGNDGHLAKVRKALSSNFMIKTGVELSIQYFPRRGWIGCFSPGKHDIPRN